jgi:hypothetical protein
MGNLSESDLNIGDIIYHPVVDPGVGFAIEEVTISKLIGPSKNPCGYSWIKWTYGDVSLLRSQEIKRNGNRRVFLKKNCYSSIEDCIEYLETRRIDFIENQKKRKDEVISEVQEMKNFLKELEAECVEVSRHSNKVIQMLGRFDIRRDLEKRGLI